MKRSDFSFDLPDELVAQRPSAERGESRLLRLDTLEIAPFSSVLDAFRGDELLIINDTRVVPARVFGQKPSGGAVELLVIEPLGQGRVLAMIRGKRLGLGAELVLPQAAGARLAARREDGTVEVELDGVDDLWGWLEDVGNMPLPPYIRRDADADDRARYQTVFAREPGAIAAPTAGLHFTPALLDAVRAKGVAIHALTLHVGPGTFRPVRVDDVSDHTMHSERFSVPPETASAIAAAIATDRPIVAVGTTVVRALEAFARDPHADRTDLFILPGFDFQVVDGLLTNFHLPESTLLMLVAALAGRDPVLAGYRAAVAARMRFYSYGDAMLVRRLGGRWT